MIYFNSNILRSFFLVLSIQVLIAGIPMPLLLTQQNKLSIVAYVGNTESECSNKNNNKHSNQKNTPEKESDLDKQMMTDEDDSSERTEFSSFSKVIDQETAIHYNFNFSRTELIKFLQFNSKDKIQFHPEFSTPPPKNTQA